MPLCAANATRRVMCVPGGQVNEPPVVTAVYKVTQQCEYTPQMTQNIAEFPLYADEIGCRIPEDFAAAAGPARVRRMRKDGIRSTRAGTKGAVPVWREGTNRNDEGPVQAAGSNNAAVIYDPIAQFLNFAGIPQELPTRERTHPPRGRLRRGTSKTHTYMIYASRCNVAATATPLQRACTPRARQEDGCNLPGP
ncbi:hypothetical protein ACI65C_012540 [Semiaphis heraclei]